MSYKEKFGDITFSVAVTFIKKFFPKEHNIAQELYETNLDKASKWRISPKNSDVRSEKVKK